MDQRNKEYNVITYHDIKVKVTDFCINDLNNEVLVKIETEDDNRWSNGWVGGLDLVFTEGDSLKATCDLITSSDPARMAHAIHEMLVKE